MSPAALGLGLEALISVSIRTGARQRIGEFRADLEHRPEVRQLFFLGGSEDFVLHVAVHDTDALREFVVEQLSAHPAVASTRTSLVFQHHENRGCLDRGSGLEPCRPTSWCISRCVVRVAVARQQQRDEHRR